MLSIFSGGERGLVHYIKLSFWTSESSCVAGRCLVCSPSPSVIDRLVQHLQYPQSIHSELDMISSHMWWINKLDYNQRFCQCTPKCCMPITKMSSFCNKPKEPLLTQLISAVFKVLTVAFTPNHKKNMNDKKKKLNNLNNVSIKLHFKTGFRTFWWNTFQSNNLSVRSVSDHFSSVAFNCSFLLLIRKSVNYSKRICHGTITWAHHSQASHNQHCLESSTIPI